MAPSKQTKKAEAEGKRTLADLGESDAPGMRPFGGGLNTDEDQTPEIVDEDAFEDDYADLDDEEG